MLAVSLIRFQYLERTVHASQLYLWVLDLVLQVTLPFHEMYHLLYQPAFCQLTFETLSVFFLLNFLLLLVKLAVVKEINLSKSFVRLLWISQGFTLQTTHIDLFKISFSLPGDPAEMARRQPH